MLSQSLIELSLESVSKINCRISPFPLFIYVLHWKKKSSAENVRLCVGVYVCVCLWVVNFLSRDNSKEVARIFLKFCMYICICFLKKLIDFGDDRPKIVRTKITIVITKNQSLIYIMSCRYSNEVLFKSFFSSLLCF